MSYRLYLDDVREPQFEGWTVVRSVEAFRDLIESKGLPDKISFDHDLGEDVPSGYDAAKWLVYYSMDHDLPLETVSINVHSANPVGAANIEGIFDSFFRFKNKG